MEKFIKSAYFEKKFSWMRRAFPYFSRKYNQVYDINIKEQSNVDDKAIQRAEAAVKLFTKPLAPEFKKDKNIPKLIWMFWNTPIDQAPEVVKLSIRSWIELNPDYEVRVLTDANLNEHLGFDFYQIFKLSTVRLHMATKADLLRMYLLKHYGGIWADATTFCLKPLSEGWLTEVTQKYKFFTFRHKTSYSRTIELWFIAALPGHPIINDTFDKFFKYIFKPRRVSLYISARRSLMEKVKLEYGCDKQLLSDVLPYAEKIGFMPYFSLNYCFVEAITIVLSKTEQAEFYNLPNKHSIYECDWPTYLSSVVSKQTYKNNHQTGQIYLKRKAHLLDILDSIEPDQ